MGIFKRKAAQAAVNVGTPLFIPISWAAKLMNGKDVNDTKLWEYYLTVPEFQAVVNYRAEVISSMQIKAYKGEREVPLPEVLNNPNPFQTIQDLLAQLSIEKDVFGNALIYMLYGTSVKATKTISMLPVANMEVVKRDGAKVWQAQSYTDMIAGYKIKYDQKEEIIKPEEAIHFYSSLDAKTMKGRSRAAALAQLMENIVTSNEARGVIMGNSALGIITNEGVDSIGTRILDPKEKQAVQDGLRNYGLTKDKYQFIVTSEKLKYQPFATSLRNLGLFDEVTNDMQALCNAYRVPAELLQSQSTYENKKEAKRQFYQDTIIPECKAILASIQSGLELDVELKADWSHISALQTDYESKARIWQTTANALISVGELMTDDEKRLVLERINMIEQ